MMDSSTEAISVNFISNLHCGSCVHTIESVLQALQPPPSLVEVSIVNQSVTVYHSKSLDQTDVLEALSMAGFDVIKPIPEGAELDKGTGSSTEKKKALHIEQCTQCQEELRGSVDTICASDSHSSTSTHHDSLEKEKGKGDVSGPTRLILSVGGMTCSSCTSTITRMVSELPGVKDVVVSLLDKSATVLVDQPELAAKVTETIEDCGFEAQVVNTEILAAKSQNKTPEDTTRVVSLRADGMFCSHCPEKVMNALKQSHPEIEVIKPITSHTDPIIKISYQPNPPFFTIRDIIDTISSSKSPPFNVAIYKPASIEELARRMQAREQRQLLYRLVVSIIVAIPTFILAIVYMSLVKDGNSTKEYLMTPIWAGNVSRVEWALLILSTPVMFYSASSFHRRSFKEIRALWRKGSRTPVWKRFVRFGSMNLLVSSGVSVAYFSSIALLVLAARQPASHMGDNTTYFDSVIFLTMFLLCGRYLEAYSKKQTSDSITALGKLRPTEALLISPVTTDLPSATTFSPETDLEKGDLKLDSPSLATPAGSRIQKISTDLLEIGDIVRVQSGATPPADGVIINHESGFDESSLTGESRIISKYPGDKIYVGTINKLKMVDMRVESVGGATMLDRIVEVVKEGQTRRAPIERVADVLTGFFVPVITLFAILTWVVWLSLGFSGILPRDYLDIPIGGWAVWSLEFAIAVFVVACPCGIGLAAPTALLVGSGLAAKFGILAHGGGEAFQEMAQLDLIVSDKTGTLTEGGAPCVTSFQLVPHKRSWSQQEILRMAVESESASTHPLAIAIRDFYKEHIPLNLSSAEEVAGRGIKAQFLDLQCTTIVGNEAWMENNGAHIDSTLLRRLIEWKTEAKSIVLQAIKDDGNPDNVFEIVAAYGISDTIREEAKGVISALHKQGVATWMISGDNKTTAEAVAKSVGIPEKNVIAEVLPHEKAERVEWLQKEGSKRKLPAWQTLFRKQQINERCIVGMVGDGINDAPALTIADVGIAIGSGSDVAISSASFILVSSNLRGILTLSDLSRKVFSRVKFNFGWALVYNMIALPIAAGFVYPAGHVRLNPVWASLAMAMSSISVVCSSLLLKLYKEPKL